MFLSLLIIYLTENNILPDYVALVLLVKYLDLCVYRYLFTLKKVF